MVELEKLFFQAKLCDSANRPEKAFNLIETIIKNKKEDLSGEERSLFSKGR